MHVDMHACVCAYSNVCIVTERERKKKAIKYDDMTNDDVGLTF